MKLAKRAFSCAVVLSVTLASSAGASADEPNDLAVYYGGERVSAYVIGGVGLAAAVGGGYLVTREGDFARGLGWSWLVMGSLEAVSAAYYAVQVGGEIDHYGATLARDPAAYRAEEAGHMEGTSRRFPYYRAVELGLTLAGAGAAAYGLGAHREMLGGAGLGVASLALPLLVIDSVNDGRAKRYLESVQRFQPAMAVGPLAVGRGVEFSFGGKF
jgi:hypothetical protein